MLKTLYDYVWVIELRDGTLIPQLNEDGSENKPIFDNVKRATWKAKNQSWKDYSVDFREGDHLILFRRMYQSVHTTPWVTYCIGKSYKLKDKDIREVMYISPPQKCLFADGKYYDFGGSVEVSSDPEFINALERFVSSFGKVEKQWLNFQQLSNP